jgi:hypothetical protein
VVDDGERHAVLRGEVGDPAVHPVGVEPLHDEDLLRIQYPDGPAGSCQD